MQDGEFGPGMNFLEIIGFLHIRDFYMMPTPLNCLLQDILPRIGMTPERFDEAAVLFWNDIMYGLELRKLEAKDRKRRLKRLVW